MVVIHALPIYFCSGVSSSNVAAIDKLIGGVMKSISWHNPATFSKCNALMDLHHHATTHTLNGETQSLLKTYNLVII